MAIDYQTLMELISDARAARTKVDGELTEAMLLVDKLRTRQVQLREEEDAYTATLTRRFPDAQPDLAPIDEEAFDLGVDMPVQVDWIAMPRTVAVERAIAEVTKSREAASPGDIQNYLNNFGRNDTRDEIGGALAHLNRTSKVESVGRAQWVPASKVSVPTVAQASDGET